MSAPSCKVVQPNEGQSYWLVGDRVRFLLDSEDTGGRLAVGELEVVPGGGPPPHVHAREDECFYVINGDLQFILDRGTFKERNGFAASLPKNVTHTFKNVGAKPAQMLVVAFPGGFDRFTREVGSPCNGPRAPRDADIQQLLATCPKYGIEMRPQWQSTPTSAPKTDDRELWVFGNHIKIKLTSADTNGQASVVEGRLPPGAGVPPHAHIREDEMFYILEGTCRFVLDGKPVEVSAGGFVYVPPGAMHGFSNPGSGTVRILNYHTPGGFESFFFEAGVPCTDPTKPPTTPIDMPRAMELMKSHGMTMA